MGYTALYRKFRPETFDQVKGQDHVVITLRNQILSGRIGHAYLFCGSRGTGKTSVAKIFARAVNCEHPLADGSPCGTCECCRAIADGSSLNVIEIDAASNNGVDNVRQIREEVSYSPSQGKYKVYIIDEVHMLSAGAFNALLKTLEEPPSYVIFILATTEVHKIPVTVLSRCQRYDFHRLSQEEIALRLQDLLEREGVAAQKQAVDYIARVADGGMRDALSLADQCISFYLGEELTYERVLDVLGTVDEEELSRFFRELQAKDLKAAFSHLDDMLYRGRDIDQLVRDYIWYQRNILMVKTADQPEQLMD
ncbi:MAG: DNA polymerase III subunit gamma/tau, partial [Lachnospiraceae bacterium]|nr:DNA polymerase III subunit gamma/tau [Lachnospiraceae bacterium]